MLIARLTIMTREKEREHAELEGLSDKSRKELSAIESTLSRLREQVKSKKQEVKSQCKKPTMSDLVSNLSRRRVGA